MSIFSVCVFGVAGAVFSVMLKSVKPEFSILAALATGTVILIYITNDLSDIYEHFKSIADNYNINGEYFKISVKACVIAYITQFSKELCKDCGENSIGVKIDVCGKISVLLLSMPIMSYFLSTVEELLEHI